jgi:hypothetical protein
MTDALIAPTTSDRVSEALTSVGAALRRVVLGATLLLPDRKSNV